MIFCFQSAEDILKKIKFERSLIEPDPQNEKDIYPIFNIITTLNHLFEWYYKDKSMEEKRRLGCINIFNSYIKKEYNGTYNDYFDDATFPGKTNPNQRIIRKICNDFKHYKVSFINCTKKQKKYTAQYGNCQWGQKQFGEYSGFKYLIKDSENNEYDILKIIDELIEQWEEFIQE